MTDEDREKVQVYEQRLFSELFHAFTTQLCLNGDAHKRCAYIIFNIPHTSTDAVQKYCILSV